MLESRRPLWIATWMFASCLAVVGCSDDEPQPTTCSEALNNLYDIGCAIFVDGDQVDRADAISGCIDERGVAESNGCLGIRQDALDCLGGADTCEECGSQMSSYNECMAN